MKNSSSFKVHGSRFGLGVAASAVVFGWVALTAQIASAQISAEELRREQVESIEALKRTENISGGSSRLFGDLGRRTGWIFQYGGASSITYTGGDDGSDRTSGTQDAQDHNYDYELKPFITAEAADRKSKLYVRGTTKYTETSKSGATGAGTRGNNFIEPTVEMMYFEKSFTNAATPGTKQKWTVGRQFVQVGRGIAFATTADGILNEHTGLAGNKGEYKWFALRQNNGDDQTDLSASGSGHTKRWFWGFRGKYQVHPKAKMSLYAVHTYDRNTEEDPASSFQKHKFQPQYYGAVSEGRLTKDLQYWGEYIMERGKTYSTGSAAVPSQKVNIRASAYTFGLKYYFQGAMSPTVFGEYVTATGDPEATASNSTTGGSAPGTNDSRFNPFGGLGLGVALSPTMTNLNVYKFGGSIKPFARSPNRMLQDLSFQPEYFVFRRRTGNFGAAGNDSVMGGSAAGAAPTTNRVGDEIDVSISWRLMSDLTYQLKYGYFSPGSAYTLKSPETYWKFKVSLDM